MAACAEGLLPRVSSEEGSSALAGFISVASPCVCVCVCTFGSGSDLTAVCRGGNANLCSSASAAAGFGGCVYSDVVNTLWRSISAY